MKNLVKLLMIVSLFAALFQSTAIGVSAESSNIAEKCSYIAKPGVNPDPKTMNCLLTEVALEYDIPPEIFKAIAEKESANWHQYDDNGNTIITSDGGIGVMQITNKEDYVLESLKTDIIYNIRAGANILDSMFKRTDLPTINEGNRDVLEHWYFSIMAYNGTKPVNSPVVKDTGKTNPNAYQEKVIDKIANLELVTMQSLPFSNSDFQYDTTSGENIEFLTMNYHFDMPFTKTNYLFKQGQKVEATSDMNIRAFPGGTDIGDINNGEILTIEGPIAYGEDPDNHFVWYPVKRGNGDTGFVASSYLNGLQFKDVPAGHYAEEEIYYLVDRDIINGIGNSEFGLSQNLKRWQAVLMIARSKNLSLGNSPNPNFEDVPKSYPYYNEISAVVDEGLFKGNKNGTFEPDSTLTRAEMAVVLQRIYKFPEASNDTPFTDVESGIWYADPISSIYEAEITKGITPTTFGPSTDVTREQFAVFMARSMNDRFR
ncbi:S-layer homology domain-containing protein [Virgibacillus sp. DJP39]|uniref:S-layer homology domain-containing protein n=1 Tax=Virgibacillus sp. DJP39 TaxID=3409790 RepID=UPI003BB744DA